MIGEYEKAQASTAPRQLQPVRVLVVDDSLAIVRTALFAICWL